MLRAVGFMSADIVSSFDLRLERIDKSFSHIVAHARPL